MNEKEKNLAQNTPVKPVEAVEGVSNVVLQPEGGTEAEAVQEGQNEVALGGTEPAIETVGQKSVKKANTKMTVAIIVGAALVLSAGVFWWFMMGPGKTTEGQVTDEVISDEKDLLGDGSSSSVSTELSSGESSDATVISEEEDEVAAVLAITEKMQLRVDQLLTEKGITDIKWYSISRDGLGGPLDVTALSVVYVRPDDQSVEVEAIKTEGYAVGNSSGQWDSAFEEAGLVDGLVALLSEEGFQVYRSDEVWHVFYNSETGVYCTYTRVGFSQFDTMFDFSCAHKTWVDKD